MFDCSDKVCLLVLSCRGHEENWNRETLILKMHRMYCDLLFSTCNVAIDDMVRREYVKEDKNGLSLTEKGIIAVRSFII